MLRQHKSNNRVNEFLFIYGFYRFMIEWYQSIVTTLMKNPDTKTHKKRTNFILLWFGSLTNKKRRIILFIVGNYGRCGNSY